MEIRLATDADIEAMHAIRLAVTENRLRDVSRVTTAKYHEMLGERGKGWVFEDDAGVIVGCAGGRAFYFDGTFHLVPLRTGDTVNCASSINPANGDIIGYGNPSNHPFLYSGGTLSDLGVASSRSVVPSSINASGTIIGNAY